MNKDQAQHDSMVALTYADELFALARKYGTVAGGCYQSQAHVALEVAARIRKSAGLPPAKADAELNARRCHWGGKR